MKKNQKNDIVCPHCGKKGTWAIENTFRPFCSERCKMIDLGNWAEEKNSVPGEPIDTDDLPDSSNYKL
jgi:endogenous inhibitor of DNA gyrase (YacG/DUF329 family)